MLSNHQDKVELPAEWEAQSATLLAWPYEDSDWKSIINEVESTYLELCKIISRYQRLIILCRNTKHFDAIRTKLDIAQISHDKYQLIICDYNDTWCRDYGPLCVRRDGSFEFHSFKFNGWNNRHQSVLDDTVCRALSEQGVFGQSEFHEHDFLLEGGCIESDGHGTILTTIRCLCSRHPDKSLDELENLLQQYIGAKNILWLQHGCLDGDDTDGHIDMMARFLDINTIAYIQCNDENDPDYEELKKMEDELGNFENSEGNSYKLIPIPLPDSKSQDRLHLPKSYLNFIMINDCLLVPQYDDPQDKVAKEILIQHNPERDVIGINSNHLISQAGSIHCATMHIPAGAI